MLNFLLIQERKQKELEKKLDQPAVGNQMSIEAEKRIEDETDDEKDELEEDIVVTKL
jgi:hypothetical protein